MWQQKGLIGALVALALLACDPLTAEQMQAKTIRDNRLGLVILDDCTDAQLLEQVSQYKAQGWHIAGMAGDNCFKVLMEKNP